MHMDHRADYGAGLRLLVLGVWLGILASRGRRRSLWLGLARRQVLRNEPFDGIRPGIAGRRNPEQSMEIARIIRKGFYTQSERRSYAGEKSNDQADEHSRSVEEIMLARLLVAGVVDHCLQTNNGADSLAEQAHQSAEQNRGKYLSDSHYLPQSSNSSNCISIRCLQWGQGSMVRTGPPHGWIRLAIRR